MSTNTLFSCLWEMKVVNLLYNNDWFTIINVHYLSEFVGESKRPARSIIQKSEEIYGVLICIEFTQ